MKFQARDFATGDGFAFRFEVGRIAAKTPTEISEPIWIAPSFFDVQINGGLGINFTDANLTEAGIRTVTAACQSHGIGGYFPTVITSSPETICTAFATLAKACEADAELNSCLPRFHLEGPFLSPLDGPRGAHPQEHLRHPDFDLFRRFQDAAMGRIGLVTLAPELPAALRLIEELVKGGLVVSIGHTAANGETIQEAIAAGATMSTHLGNGLASNIDRHRNPLWDQLASDDLTASLIADGHHLPSAALTCFLRMKTPNRAILTCDASPLAGCAPGKYPIWGAEVEVLESGKVVLSGTPYLAGSGVFLDSCVSHILNSTETTLPEAIEMASIRPRELFGLPVPRVELGGTGPFVVFRWRRGERLEVLQLIHRGASF